MIYVPSIFFRIILFLILEKETGCQTDRQTETIETLLSTAYFVTKLKMLR